MKTVEFNKITGVVKSYIAELREMYTACNDNGIITVEHLTIGQATDLSERARDLQSKTDQFLKQDLYHVIGMGNLSASQMATTTKLVKDLTEHRTLMKTLAALPALPKKISTSSEYKSKSLGVKLKS
jgi:hypothetical protein